MMTVGCALAGGFWERIEDVEFRTIARALSGGLGALFILAAVVNLPARIVVDADGLRFLGAWGRRLRSVNWGQVQSWYVRRGFWNYSISDETGVRFGPFYKHIRNIVFQLVGDTKETVLETQVALPFVSSSAWFDGIVEAVRAHLAAKEILAPAETAPEPA